MLEVEPITVARLIDRLEARGMVERRPDPRDRRIWRLHLLRPAHDVLHEIDEQRADMTRMVTAGIDDEPIGHHDRGIDADESDPDPGSPRSPPRRRRRRDRSAGGRLMSQAAMPGPTPRVAIA